MRKIFVAAATAIAVGVSSFALAQQQPAASQATAAWSAEDSNAFIEARIAALKATLKLTPAQEKNWPGVESAIRDISKQRVATRDKLRAGAAKLDPIVLLRDRADAMTEAAAGMRRLADVSEPLYKSLDDNQKCRLLALVVMGRRR